jgi:hypothetical protein
MDSSGSVQEPITGFYHYSLYENTLLTRPKVSLVISNGLLDGLTAFNAQNLNI